MCHRVTQLDIVILQTMTNKIPRSSGILRREVKGESSLHRLIEKSTEVEVIQIFANNSSQHTQMDRTNK